MAGWVKWGEQKLVSNQAAPEAYRESWKQMEERKQATNKRLRIEWLHNFQGLPYKGNAKALVKKNNKTFKVTTR